MISFLSSSFSSSGEVDSFSLVRDAIRRVEATKGEQLQRPRRQLDAEDDGRPVVAIEVAQQGGRLPLERAVVVAIAQDQLGKSPDGRFFPGAALKLSAANYPLEIPWAFARN